MTSFKFKPVGGSDDDAQKADNCKDFAIKNIAGRLVSISEYACAVLVPRKKIPSESDLGKTHSSVIKLLNTNKDLKLFQHLSSDLEAAAPMPEDKKKEQAAEGKEPRAKRSVKALESLGQEDDGTETGSKSSRSTSKKTKAPSIATSAKTLAPLHEELQT